MVDSDAATWTIDVGLVQDHLSEAARRGTLPAAVVAVDIYGQCADYDALAQVCEPYAVPGIADAAEALGARYKGRPAGSPPGPGVLSLNATKNNTPQGAAARWDK